jgi:hypothetical protein
VSRETTGRFQSWPFPEGAVLPGGRNSKMLSPIIGTYSLGPMLR